MSAAGGTRAAEEEEHAFQNFCTPVALYDLLAKRHALNPTHLRRNLSYRLAASRTRTRELARAHRIDKNNQAATSKDAVPSDLNSTAVVLDTIDGADADKHAGALTFVLAADIVDDEKRAKSSNSTKTRTRIRCAKRIWPSPDAPACHLPNDGGKPGIGILVWRDGPHAQPILGVCQRGCAPLPLLTPAVTPTRAREVAHAAMDADGDDDDDDKTKKAENATMPRLCGVIPHGASVLWAHVKAPKPGQDVATDVLLQPCTLRVHMPANVTDVDDPGNTDPSDMEVDLATTWPVIELLRADGDAVRARVRLAPSNGPMGSDDTMKGSGPLLAWWSTERCRRPLRACPYPRRATSSNLLTKAERSRLESASNGAGPSDAPTARASHHEVHLEAKTRQLVEGIAARDVLFQYIFDNGQRRRTEMVSGYRCPFCECACGSFRGMQLHLMTNHDRFSFAFSAELEHQSAAALVHHDQQAHEYRRAMKKLKEVKRTDNDAAYDALMNVSKPPFPSLCPNVPTVAVTARPARRSTEIDVSEELLGAPLAREFALVVSRGSGASDAAECSASVRRFEAEAAAQAEAAELANELLPPPKSRRKTASLAVDPPPPLPGPAIGDASAQGLTYLRETRIAASGGAAKRKQLKASRATTSAQAAANAMAAMADRDYFYSRTCQPITPEDVVAAQLGGRADTDSDDDDGFGSEGEYAQEVKDGLEEYEELREDDRRFMMLWNIQCRRRRVLVDVQMPVACECFALDQAKELNARPGVKRAFMMHMLTLQDHGFVDAPCIDHCLLLLDRQARMGKDGESAKGKDAVMTAS